MSHKHEKFYLIYILWLLIFVFSTNQYYDFNEIVSINQLDSVSYMAIANSSPNYSSEIIPYHHAQRVFFPYLIGIVANIFNFEVFFTFKLFTFLSLMMIIFVHYLIVKKFKTDFFFSIILISLLILNPYIFRYFIAVPTMINDVIFILSLYLFSYSLKFNSSFTLQSVFLGLVSRQNGIFIFIANLINILLKSKTKFFVNKSLIFSLLILIVVFLISNNYASEVSIHNFNYKHIYGIFQWLINDWNFLEFVKWMSLPFYSYLPIIVFFFMYRKLKDYQKNTLKDQLILIFLFLSIIGISFLPGPEMAGRNIIRQTTLAYPIILVWLSWFTVLKVKTYNKSLVVLIIFILHLWSLHPTYSNISLFGFLRNYLF